MKINLTFSNILMAILEGNTDVKENKMVRHNGTFINTTRLHYEVCTQR